MTSKPDDGEDGALGDAIDLPDDSQSVEETPVGSNVVDKYFKATEGKAEAEITPDLEVDERRHESAETDSGSLQESYDGNDTGETIRGISSSVEDTTSIPDDTPSIQVCFASLVSVSVSD